MTANHFSNTQLLLKLSQADRVDTKAVRFQNIVTPGDQGLVVPQGMAVNEGENMQEQAQVVQVEHPS